MHTLIIMGLLAVLAIGFAVFKTRRNRSGVILANIGEGTHGDGKLTKLTDAAQATRFVFVKFGTDAEHVAVCAAGDNPLGICTDEASAAELPVNVKLLSNSPGTSKITLGGTVAAGDYGVPSTGGVAIKLPTTGGGTAYPCVRFLKAGVSGDVVEVETFQPHASVTIGA